MVVLIGITGLVSGCFCSWLAEEKGREFGIWFFLGLLFGPLALLTLIGAPVMTQHVSQQTQRAERQPVRGQPVRGQPARSQAVRGRSQSSPSPVDEYLAMDQRARNRARREEIEKNRNA